MLTPRTQASSVPELTPALAFLLMVGEQASGRIVGCWSLILDVLPSEFDAYLDSAWRAHAPTLTAEAAAHGFEPFAATGRTPEGDGFTRWRDQFLKTHRY